ncbi:MAG: FAD-dependent oxidoreductase, partial [Chryseolinea sp.]
MSEVNLNTFAPTSLRPQSSTRETPVLPISARVIVVGAGAFGGWSALYLQRQGYRVTLVDAWGPGNSRSSSGDETRVIRSTYGDNETYFDLNVRALQLWKEHEMAFGHKVFYNSGVIWFCYNESTPLVDDSIPFARKHSHEYEYLSQSDLTRRYPLINTKDLHHAYLDPYGGYLKARESAIEVQTAFVKAGGRYIQQHAKPGSIGTSLDKVILENGDELVGDLYLFAC